MLPLLLAKVESVERRVPVQICSAEGGWPFQLEVAIERGLDLQRMRGFNFESNDCSRIAHRDEQSFLYRKRVACINNCARLRTNRNGPYKRFGRKGTAVHQKMHMKIAKDFERVDPGLQIATLVSEQASSHAGGAEKFPRPGVAGKF